MGIAGLSEAKCGILAHMRRIAVIGSGGAGKSALARRLGEILGIEVYHLDAIHWKPGWTPTPEDEWREINEKLAACDEWIIDGNYGSTLDVRLAAADTVVFLDYPRSVCLWRAFKRRLQYHGKTRPDMGSGCREQIDWGFLKWIWRYPKDSRPSVIAKIEAFAQHATVIHLRSPREAEVFLGNSQLVTRKKPR